MWDGLVEAKHICPGFLATQNLAVAAQLHTAEFSTSLIGHWAFEDTNISTGDELHQCKCTYLWDAASQDFSITSGNGSIGGSTAVAQHVVLKPILVVFRTRTR